MNKVLSYIMSVLSLVLVFSCTDAELCPEPLYEHPHYANVSYSFNWDQHEREQMTERDSMYVLAYRVINMWKSTMAVSCLDNPARGRYLLNMLEEREAPINNNVVDSIPTDSVTSDSALETTSSIPKTLESFLLKSGDYKFVAFSRNDSEIDYSSVENYLNHDDVPLSEMNVIYKSYAKGDSLLRFTIPDWVDFNAYGDKDRYIQPSLQPIFYDTIAVKPLRANGKYQIEFVKPKQLTQHIEFIFYIRKVVDNQPFTVDSVFAEISGVPYVINLANGYIDIQKTKKLMFKTEFEQDTESNKLIQCRGIIDVPTIVESTSEDLFMGPGIMQVMIMCSAQDTLDSSKRLNKKFQGSINLYNTLTNARLMRFSDDRKHVIKNGDNAVIVIGTEMKINGEHILENPDDNAGLDRWRKEEKNPPIIDI